MRARLLVLPLLAAVLAAGLSGCTAGTPGQDQPAAAAATLSVSAGPLPSEVVHGSDPYIGLAQMLHARGVRVWWETDLVKRWLEGPESFRTAVTRLARLARVPGTVGFKIADELGYGDGLTARAQVLRFLQDAHAALARVAPGKKLLVDAVVPELGCLPWRAEATSSCVQEARSKYPQLTTDAVTDYLRSGMIDDFDLSTSLLDPSYYAARGLTIDQAQAEAWAHAVGWRWPQLTSLRARKALAAAGGYQGSPADAAADVRLYVDIPVGHGAASVDLWTWRQVYQSRTVSLLGPGLTPNPLWTALAAEHARGVALFTNMTPSQMPTEARPFAHECDVAASVFTDVFVAAGTG